MKCIDVFARAAGGAAGVAAAILVPHIGCLAALTPLAVTTGAGFAGATALTGMAGAGALAGAGMAAWYGVRPSQAACCRFFGETRAVRLKKGVAVALFGFVAAAGYNTLRDEGRVGIVDRIALMSSVHDGGGSVWDVQRMVNLICAPTR